MTLRSSDLHEPTISEIAYPRGAAMLLHVQNSSPVSRERNFNSGSAQLERDPDARRRGDRNAILQHRLELPFRKRLLGGGGKAQIVWDFGHHARVADSAVGQDGEVEIDIAFPAGFGGAIGIDQAAAEERYRVDDTCLNRWRGGCHGPGRRVVSVLHWRKGDR